MKLKLKLKVTAKAIAIAAFLMTTGCLSSAEVGVGERVALPKDSAERCTNLCGSIGMALDSVVVMASNVGCVCRAAPAPGAPPASSAGGMAAILIQEAAAAAQQQQQQQQHRPPPPPPAPIR
jgi:hypothetical protein